LNEKFKVHSYDGGSFKSQARYDVKNALIPIIEPFHCSGNGTKFNLVLKCSEDFTLTHFYVSGPGPKCTEPIKSGLVWVVDNPPNVECMKKYESLSSEELMEIMKGLRSYSTTEEPGSLPDPCAYFTTDPESRETEVELARWREGKYVVVKFLDTHKDRVNIDVGIIALIGYFGRNVTQQVPLGPWMRRTQRRTWVHQYPLKSMFSSSGWVCDGRDFTGGCRSGQTDFHQTSVYTVTFRCATSGFDLCEKCAYDETLGRVTGASMQADLEALADPATCKLAVNRLRNQWKRNWMATLPKFFEHGLLDVLVQALHKCTESSKGPDEERTISQRLQSGPEAQKRQIRRALLQLMTELTQRLLNLSMGADLNVNDLVWALCPEPEEHWDEGRIIQLPKLMPGTNAPWNASSSSASPSVPITSKPALGDAASASGQVLNTSNAPPEKAASQLDQMLIPGASESSNSAEQSAGETEAAAEQVANCFLISWRNGQAPCRVNPRNVWKMTADEDVMIATASLFVEIHKGEACDPGKVNRFLEQGADLMAVNSEGSTALLAAVRSEAPAEVTTALLEQGACPDVTGKEGVTPLQQVRQLQRQSIGDGARLDRCACALQQHGAVEPEDANAQEHLQQLRETFGLKMVSALLTLQSPLALPLEVLEVMHLLFRELPLDVLKQALEPQAFRALTALLQHFVGATDNLSMALVGCRMMRALYSRGDPTLQDIVRSHGALRWSERLSATKDIAKCGLYRQAHHEKVTPEELRKEAKALYDDLCKGQAGQPGEEEWHANTRLVQIVAPLNTRTLETSEWAGMCKEALAAFRELLKKTEKGTMQEERCTAYELERAGIPGLLLHFLKQQAPPGGTDPIRHPSMHPERWAFFREVFSEQTKQTRKGLIRLMKAFHAVIETGEEYPVWRRKKEIGLKALTEPIPLKLRLMDGCPQEFITPFFTSIDATTGLCHGGATCAGQRGCSLSPSNHTQH